MLPLTHELQKRITMKIKNKEDISDLIRDVDIRNGKFQYAIIKDFTRLKTNMSGADFSNAVIGEKGKITNISGSNMTGCNFSDVTFVGKIFMRRCNCTDVNFSGADGSNVEYQNTLFYGAKFCETLLRLGTAYGLGARFSKDFFKDLEKGWNVTITLND